MSRNPGQNAAREALARLAGEALHSLEGLRAGLEDYERHLRRFRAGTALPAEAAELARRTDALLLGQRLLHLEFETARSRAAALRLRFPTAG